MNLDDLRNKIDKIDEGILRLFEERMDVVSQVAMYKKANNIPVLDSGREAEKLQAISGKVMPQLEPLAHILFTNLFELSRSHQNSMLESAVKNTDS